MSRVIKISIITIKKYLLEARLKGSMLPNGALILRNIIEYTKDSSSCILF